MFDEFIQKFISGQQENKPDLDKELKKQERQKKLLLILKNFDLILEK